MCSPGSCAGVGIIILCHFPHLISFFKMSSAFGCYLCLSKLYWPAWNSVPASFRNLQATNANTTGHSLERQEMFAKMSNKKQMVPDSLCFKHPLIRHSMRSVLCSLLGLVPSMDQSQGHNFRKHLNQKSGRKWQRQTQWQQARKSSSACSRVQNKTALYIAVSIPQLKLPYLQAEKWPSVYVFFMGNAKGRSYCLLLRFN